MGKFLSRKSESTCLGVKWCEEGSRHEFITDTVDPVSAIRGANTKFWGESLIRQRKPASRIRSHRVGMPMWIPATWI